MTAYPDKDIRAALYVESEPLTNIEETEHDWRLGRLGLSKRHRSFHSGYSHPLRAEARFYRQWFDFGDEQRGWAVIFRAIDPLPTTHNSDVFVGWVEPNRESEVDKWLAFLNNEIAKRFGASGLPDAAT